MTYNVYFIGLMLQYCFLLSYYLLVLYCLKYRVCVTCLTLWKTRIKTSKASSCISDTNTELKIIKKQQQTNKRITKRSCKDVQRKHTLLFKNTYVKLTIEAQIVYCSCILRNIKRVLKMTHTFSILLIFFSFLHCVFQHPLRAK